MDQFFIAGNKGEKIRSDCFVNFQPRKAGGLEVRIKSKVKALYGNDIYRQAIDILHFFGIENASMLIEDSGALPLVLAARMEAAISQFIKVDREYLIPSLDQNRYPSTREHFRVSRLYLPGNTPSMMINAGIHHPDGIILDLEDSVAQEKKQEARIMVRNALCGIDFYGAERMVRINKIPEGLIDLPYIVPHNVHVILVPKCESPDQIHQLEQENERIKNGIAESGEIYFMPIIESALGVERSFEIAGSSDKIIALALGLEDLTADLGVQRTEEGHETLYARQRIVNACKAARIQAIDSVYSDVANEEGLKKFATSSRALGFEGMGCIHPRQIRTIHEGFSPTPEEIEKAHEIAAAWEMARESGSGVVALGSKMIDPPVVKRALRTIQLAEKAAGSGIDKS